MHITIQDIADIKYIIRTFDGTPPNDADRQAALELLRTIEQRMFNEVHQPQCTQ